MVGDSGSQEGEADRGDGGRQRPTHGGNLDDDRLDFGFNHLLHELLLIPTPEVG